MMLPSYITNKEEYYDGTPTTKNIVGWYDYSYMAAFILPRLIMLLNDKKGYPVIDGVSDTSDDALNRARWDHILRDMIYTMGSVVYDMDMEEGFDKSRSDKGAELFGKYFFHLWS